MAEAAIMMKRSTTSAEQGPVTCPLSASQAYGLGIRMHTAVLNEYTALTEKCASEGSIKVLKSLIDQKKKSIASLEGCFNYALNCEMGRFYNSGGMVLETDLVAKEVADSKPIIMRNLDNFYADMKKLDAADSERYLSNPQAFAKFANTYMMDLFSRLSRLYPEGEISKTFKDMADTIK